MKPLHTRECNLNRKLKNRFFLGNWKEKKRKEYVRQIINESKKRTKGVENGRYLKV